MPRNQRDLRLWAQSYEGRKIIRFTATSVISTLISETVILIVYGFRLVPGEIEATLIGNVAAMTPAYQLDRRWAWGKRGRSSLRREVLPFLAMSFSGTLVAFLGATYSHHLVHTHHWAHLTNTATVAGTNIASFAVFWVLKILLFNRIFHSGGAQRPVRARAEGGASRGSS